MAIKSPSLLWNINQGLSEPEQVQARQNAGVLHNTVGVSNKTNYDPAVSLSIPLVYNTDITAAAQENISKDYVTSYTGVVYGGTTKSNLLMASYNPGTTEWRLGIDGKPMAQFTNADNTVSGQTRLSNQLMIAEGAAGVSVRPLTTTVGDAPFYDHQRPDDTQDIGRPYQPVYVKDGVVSAMPRLEVDWDEPSKGQYYSGITMRYDRDNDWYLVGSHALQSYFHYEPESGTAPDVVEEHIAYGRSGGILFGDGFGWSDNINTYWGLDIPHNANHNTLLVEAPSVTYAYTTLANSGFDTALYPQRLTTEIYNTQRLGGYTPLCPFYRTSNINETGYIATTTFYEHASLCAIPPHHWGFINGVIQGNAMTKSGQEGVTVTYEVDPVYIDQGRNRITVSQLPSIHFAFSHIQHGTKIYTTTYREARPFIVDTIDILYDNPDNPSQPTGFILLTEYTNDHLLLPASTYDMYFYYIDSLGGTANAGTTNFYFGLVDGKDSITPDTIGTDNCIGYALGRWGYISKTVQPGGIEYNIEAATLMDICPFSFFCYNPTDNNKYIVCNQMPNAGVYGEYTINKQLLIVKTPEHGGLDIPARPIMQTP